MEDSPKMIALQARVVELLRLLRKKDEQLYVLRKRLLRYEKPSLKKINTETRDVLLVLKGVKRHRLLRDGKGNLLKIENLLESGAYYSIKELEELYASLGMMRTRLLARLKLLNIIQPTARQFRINKMGRIRKYRACIKEIVDKE